MVYFANILLLQTSFTLGMTGPCPVLFVSTSYRGLWTPVSMGYVSLFVYYVGMLRFGNISDSWDTTFVCWVCWAV